MGKYMKKAKISAEVALMEVTPFGGVRTRAKTLSLLRLQFAGGESSAASSASSSCYLQLRSRRLEKLVPVARPRENAKPNPRHSANHSPNPRPGPASSLRSHGTKKDEVEVEVEGEASFGENILELEGRSSSGRNTRETTPCNLIRDSDTIRAPGSSTRPNNSTTTRTTRRVPSSIQRNIPTSHEMDEFFSGPEKVQQKAFAEKYNFDPVKDRPLPGRYEWVKLEW